MAYIIPENKIEEIRQAADIVDVVSEVIRLKKTGKNYVGLCPFHSEKTPSFSVSPEKQMFYCFGCGIGGSVFHFLMKYEGFNFLESVRVLARRYNIILPTPRLSLEEQQRIQEQEGILALNEEARNFFHHHLMVRPGSLSYLKNRGVSSEILDMFQLGYAPPDWQAVLSFFKKKGISLELLEKSGLIIPKKDKPEYYDRFRNRIIFPIINLRHQVVGFGGRVMDDSLPKYLNSPETMIFKKRRSLYGLHVAKQACRASETVYMAEGYFDVLALFQHGISNAVATLGTALTPDHLRLLSPYVRQVILVYDSDRAGIQAALRSVEIFRQEDMDARIMILPRGHDPDSFLLEFGPEAFVKQAEKALSIMNFLTEAAIEKYGLSVQGRVRIISAMQTPLKAIRDLSIQALYARELAERIGVNHEMVLEKVIQAASPVFSDAPMPPLQRPAKAEKLERGLIAMMLQFPEIIPEVEKRHLIHYFDTPVLKSVGQMILLHKERLGDRLPELINIIDDTEKRQIVASLAFGEYGWTHQSCLTLMAQFESGYKKRRQNNLQKIKAATKQNNQALLSELLRQRQTQAKERQSST